MYPKGEIMASPIQLHQNQEFISELKECTKLLIEKLQGDHYDEAAQLIHAMTEARDRHIFQSVGRLTRGLHDAIVNFNLDGDFSREPPSIESSEMRDASNRLTYVIDMTQQAAERTMDKVEEAAPIATEMGQEADALRTEWARLKTRDMSADEFRVLYARMDQFLENMVGGAGQLSKNLQEIILEQGFQDLTGQVLKRVIGLISDVEQDLVSLVRIAGQVEEITGLQVEADSEGRARRSEEHTSELQSRPHLVCRLLLEKINIR